MNRSSRKVDDTAASLHLLDFFCSYAFLGRRLICTVFRAFPIFVESNEKQFSSLSYRAWFYSKLTGNFSLFKKTVFLIIVSPVYYNHDICLFSMFSAVVVYDALELLSSM